jgi:hypothetical protein
MPKLSDGEDFCLSQQGLLGAEQSFRQVSRSSYWIVEFVTCGLPPVRT